MHKLYHIALSLILLVFVSAAAVAQTVSGKVTSKETGEPLIGVNVVIKGTQTGAVTDIDGNYTVEAGKDAVLVFSFVGLKTVQVPVENRSVINVPMAGNLKELQEVVVTAFGISREKKALGYSVEQIGSEEIGRSAQTNVAAALQGKIPGIQVSKSGGAPGAGMDILIRGISSLSPGRSNKPLYIIDGVEIGDDSDVLPITPSAGSNAVGSSTQSSVSNRAVDINVEDIETMSVLKGAAATSLYGIRAANGAIIITTKKGSAGKPKIDLRISGGWESINKSPAIQRDFIDGNRSTSLQRSFIWDSWGAKVFSGESDPTRDIYNEFFQTGYNSSFGISVTAGTDKFNYRVSADRFQQSGIVANTDWEKLNFSLAAGYKISDKMKIDASVRYSNTGGTRPHEGDKSIMSTLAYIATVADTRNYKQPYDFSNNYAVGIIDHPMYLAEHDTYTDNVDRYISSLRFTYDLTKNIKLNYSVGSDTYSDSRTRIVDPETDEGSQVQGFMVEQRNNKRSYTSNFFASMDYDFGDVSLSGVLGQYIYTSDKKWISTRGESFAIKNFFNLNNTANIFQSNAEIKYRNAAVYGEITAGYKDFLYLTVSGRNDWSSTLPKNNNSYFFPAVSASWVVSDMIDLPDVITMAKFRASYAVVGKDTGPYEIGRYVQLAGNFPFDGALGFGMSTLIGDENLKPEFTKSLEFGADLRFFQNKLQLDVSYYKNDLTDMILSVPLSNATGASRYVTNAGSMTNSGLELMLTGKLIEQGDFNWTGRLNWSTQKGEVTSIADGIEEIVLYSAFGITNKYVRGGSIGDMYGYKYKRSPDGQLIINNGYPEVNWDQLELAGNAFPDFIAGFTNTVEYKGLTLSAMLEWKKGGKVLDMGRRNAVRNGQLLETGRRNEQVVFQGVTEIKDADGAVTGYEQNTEAVEITGVNFYRSTTRYNYAAEVLLEDASWFRIRNINLSYQMPKAWFKTKYISGANLSFTAYNVYLSTPFKGFDPETNYFGSGSNIYGYSGLKTPGTRSYSFKLNLSF